MSIEYLNPEDRYDIEVFNRNFAEIEDKINALEDANPALITPEQVYAETRPADWLPMPMPEDNEIYLLFHIPDGLSGLIAFRVVANSLFKVETGTVRNGAFVPLTTSGNHISGTTYQAELFAEDYGDLTSDGFKQAMIKISAARISIVDLTQSHSKRSTYNYFNIVEISGMATNMFQFLVGTQQMNKACIALRYFALYGKNKIIADGANIFRQCQSLITVRSLDTSLFTSSDNMFAGCAALITHAEFDLQNCTTTAYMYDGCYSLISSPLKNITTENVSYMYRNCSSLIRLPNINIKNATYAQYFVSSCAALRGSVVVDMPADTTLSYSFYSCRSLQEIDVQSIPLVTSLSYFASNCSSLKRLKIAQAPKVTNMSYLANGSGVETVELDTTVVTTLQSAFTNCYRLRRVVFTHIGTALNNMTSTFSGCLTLQSLLFDQTVTGWAGVAVTLNNCSLSHQAIIDFFDSLPTITAAKAITLTGNPGVSELTDADKAIATQKGWTLTL